VDRSRVVTLTRLNSNRVSGLPVPVFANLCILKPDRRIGKGDKMDPEIRALIQVLIEGQILTDKALRALTENVDQFVTSCDARSKRLEENLDGLIRA